MVIGELLELKFR